MTVDELTGLVSARALYKTFQYQTSFATWMKLVLIDFDLVEGRDFLKFKNITRRKGRPRIEYFLTSDSLRKLLPVLVNTRLL